MAFWSKKKLIDIAAAFFKDNNVTVERKDDVLTFEIYLKERECSLYPYIKFDDENDDMSFLVNLRHVDDTSSIYFDLNKFNLKSKILVAKLSEDNMLYLEYNINTSTDSIKDDLKIIIENVLSLQEDIDRL